MILTVKKLYWILLSFMFLKDTLFLEKIFLHKNGKNIGNAKNL